MDTTFGIQAPHEEALALLAGKRPVASEIFRELLPELRGRAFTVSGVAGAGTLQRCRDAIAGIADGATWDDAKKDLLDELDPWLGDGAPARAELLLRAHGFQAFQAAAWRTAQADDDTTHLQYLTMEDERVRPSHAALDGIVLPKDDPFWQTHLPPWEWGCRCSTRTMNGDQVADEQQADRNRNPEDQNVLAGPVREQLRNGTLMRNGQRYDVTPPSHGPDAATAYQWSPDNLRLSLDELKSRYDSDVWAAFESWARETKISPALTVWQWLSQRQRDFA